MEERKVAGIIADEVTAANHTQEALDEIMGISSDTHQFIYEKMLVGIINQDYDSTSGNAPDKKSRQKMLKGSVKTIKTENDDQDDYEITCPYTGSTEVYQVSSNVFASYETDQPFSVDFDEED
jgi:hypothetical protein